MYPAEQLTELAAQKLAVRARIAAHRTECVGHAQNVARPIALYDRFAAQWRRISPYAKFAAIPLGLLLGSRLQERQREKGWRRYLKLMPIALSATRLLGKLKGR